MACLTCKHYSHYVSEPIRLTIWKKGDQFAPNRSFWVAECWWKLVKAAYLQNTRNAARQSDALMHEWFNACPCDLIMNKEFYLLSVVLLSVTLARSSPLDLTPAHLQAFCHFPILPTECLPYKAVIAIFAPTYFLCLSLALSLPPSEPLSHSSWDLSLQKQGQRGAERAQWGGGHEERVVERAERKGKWIDGEVGEWGRVFDHYEDPHWLCRWCLPIGPAVGLNNFTSNNQLKPVKSLDTLWTWFLVTVDAAAPYWRNQNYI